MILAVSLRMFKWFNPTSNKHVRARKNAVSINNNHKQVREVSPPLVSISVWACMIIQAWWMGQNYLYCIITPGLMVFDNFLNFLQGVYGLHPAIQIVLLHPTGDAVRGGGGDGWKHLLEWRRCGREVSLSCQKRSWTQIWMLMRGIIWAKDMADFILIH